MNFEETSESDTETETETTTEPSSEDEITEPTSDDETESGDNQGDVTTTEPGTSDSGADDSTAAPVAPGDDTDAPDDNNPDIPDIGDSVSAIALMLGIISAFFIAFVLIKKKNKAAIRALSIVLCLSLTLSGFLSVGAFKSKANSQNTFEVVKSISVDNKTEEIHAVVTYTQDITNEELKLTSSPKNWA